MSLDSKKELNNGKFKRISDIRVNDHALPLHTRSKTLLKTFKQLLIQNTFKTPFIFPLFLLIRRNFIFQKNFEKF